MVREREEPGVRKGQEGPGVPGGRGIGLAGQWLGPGNTNKRLAAG